jgi:hypothetical protein
MKVIVSGMECAGSTAIWQMIQQLGYDVRKEHGFTPSNNCIVFATLRDIRDVVVSLWRRECLGVRNDPDNYALGCWKYIQPRFDEMKKYQSERVPIIQYEYFIEDPGETLRMICNHLNVWISDDRRSEILDYCSLEKNKSRSQTMTNFSEWNHENLVHGNHISTGGKVGSWLDLIPELKPETVEFIEREARPFLLYFGYETN